MHFRFRSAIPTLARRCSDLSRSAARFPDCLGFPRIHLFARPLCLRFAGVSFSRQPFAALFPSSLGIPRMYFLAGSLYLPRVMNPTPRLLAAGFAPSGWCTSRLPQLSPDWFFDCSGFLQFLLRCAGFSALRFSPFGTLFFLAGSTTSSLRRRFSDATPGVPRIVEVRSQFGTGLHDTTFCLRTPCEALLVPLKERF